MASAFSMTTSDVSLIRVRLADRYLSVCWDMEEILARKDEIVSNGLLKINLKR